MHVTFVEKKSVKSGFCGNRLPREDGGDGNPITILTVYIKINLSQNVNFDVRCTFLRNFYSLILTTEISKKRTGFLVICRLDKVFKSNGIVKQKAVGERDWSKKEKSVPEPDEVGNLIEEVVNFERQINLEVDSDDIQELQNSHNQELTTDDFIAIHEQDIEKFESLDSIQSEDQMTVGNLTEGLG
ncbi:tigger transposable element-derived protein 1 [Trichonephila clavipes]|nr:tigger transposable element-derived protein 1 [Trichonephila clavipes]